MLKIYPDYSEFSKRSKRGSTVPIFAEMLADMETPVSVYKKISAKSDYSFLLESVEGGKNIGRYSFIGCDPQMVFRCKNREGELLTRGKKESFAVNTRPLEIMKDIFKKIRYVSDARLPAFCGGAVGYVSYDYIRFLEDIPDGNKDMLDAYDVYFVVCHLIIVFDHVKRKIQIVANVETDGKNPRKSYNGGVRRIEKIIKVIRRGAPLSPGIKPSRARGRMRSNFTRDEFVKAVKQCQRYIAEGDILQTVLSQQFAKSVLCDPFDIYRTLRTINPSPYMFYLDFDGFSMIGSSPEIMVKLTGAWAQVRPIAGTRPRGGSEEEDQKLMDNLLADEKERAEHVMLVDLGRNDLGRVCEPGSVSVTDLMTIEKYSHVMHIVSNVRGRLKKGYDAFDLFEATFPAGTVSGAPKIRAMEIIDELEPTRRGPYAGAVGYFSFSGDADTCITIRTVIVKDKKAYVQAGAGIVADSVPGREYEETLNKARAMFGAVLQAEQGVL